MRWRSTRIGLLLLMVGSLVLFAPDQSPLAQNPSENSIQSPTSQSSPPQDDVVRVETDLVTTLFTALDKNRRFVNTLRAEDVRIKEDGVVQEIAFFERETERPLTFVVLVDTSASQEDTLPMLKSAAKLFVKSVLRPEKDSVAVVSFNGRPKVEFGLSNNPAQTLEAIDRVRVELPTDGCEDITTVLDDPRCWTSIWDSVISSVGGLLTTKRKGTRRAIILLSDGDDTSSRATRDEAIASSVRGDVVIYGIGIGDPEKYRLDKSALRKLAERTGGRAFFPKEGTELSGAFAEIESEMRSQYVIAYTPSNRSKNGTYRKLKIEITNPALRKRKLELLHRPGYYAVRQTH